jgi:molybdopterin/thiamine biosynthesis adenylyltransferase
MHRQSSIGTPKVSSAKTMLQELNPNLKVVTQEQKVSTDLLDQLLPTATVVLDCTDNFSSRHLINAACVKHKTPLVSGAAIRFDGQLTVIDPRQTGTPCYACLFPKDQKFDEVQCSTMGVFSPLVGIIGAMQAAQALQVITGVGKSLCGKLLLWDARSTQIDTIELHQRDNCEVCSKSH